MNKHRQIYTMTISAILIAVGTVVPMFMPKVMIGPMSFTLASHVAVMIGLFISPQVAIAVALGTTLGFLTSGTPFIVVLRAFSHVVWAMLGALYIQRYRDIFKKPSKTIGFNIGLALLHGVLEMMVVIPFYMGDMDFQSFIYMVGGLVGLGTVLHSTVDFTISLVVWKALSKNRSVAEIANVKEVYILKKA